MQAADDVALADDAVDGRAVAADHHGSDVVVGEKREQVAHGGVGRDRDDLGSGLAREHVADPHGHSSGVGNRAGGCSEASPSGESAARAGHRPIPARAAAGRDRVAVGQGAEERHRRVVQFQAVAGRRVAPQHPSTPSSH